MANYLSAIKRTLSFEGGWFKLEHTYRGIMRKAHPDWPGWRIVDSKQPLKHNQIIPELEADVIAFYKAHYWDKIRLDEVCNDAIAGFVFDVFVNGGGSGLKMIQRAVGVIDDGVIGNKTIAAINNYNGGIAGLKKQREAFYRAIVANNPSKRKFLSGWLNRNNSF